MFETSVSETVQLTALHDPIFNIIIPPPYQYIAAQW
jgi:hypothetical protein